MLRMVDIAGSIRLRPYNALAFCASMAAFVFVLLMTIGMVLCSFLWSGGDPILPRLPQLDAEPSPQFGVLVRSPVVSDP